AADTDEPDRQKEKGISHQQNHGVEDGDKEPVGVFQIENSPGNTTRAQCPKELIGPELEGLQGLFVALGDGRGLEPSNADGVREEEYHQKLMRNELVAECVKADEKKTGDEGIGSQPACRDNRCVGRGKPCLEHVPTIDLLPGNVEVEVLRHLS